VTLNELNELSADDAEREFLKCCGSPRWARFMTQRRPFDSLPDVLTAADEISRDLSDADWLEAFAAHPRIGERSMSAWSQDEQEAALNAGADTQQKLAQRNLEYEDKFGFIFIVFATGKTPEEILALIDVRIENDHETEIDNAAAEQQQITRNRLLKLLDL
jgi:OHCU decarboxylase